MTGRRLNVGVYGLWHLGCVTAAACASVGHLVLAIDDDLAVLEDLHGAKAPISEPGLDAMIEQAVNAGRLKFAAANTADLSQLDVLWVTFDTPVDENDVADIGFVRSRVEQVLPRLPTGCVVLLSSQLPIGSAKHMEMAAKRLCPQLRLEIAVSPENLRLGRALDVFLKPDRVVVGVRTTQGRKRLSELFAPIGAQIEWMSPESAEMSKHAINAFLATSVTFANEIALLCEKLGADAKDVERSLKTESRIGPKAYLGPGSAFAGGTLARDISFLNELACVNQVSTPVLSAVRPSNNHHRNWERNKLQSLLGTLGGKTVALWGLTYKPGTDTLRRSTAVELGDWLLAQGAQLQVHDPVVAQLPAAWQAAGVERLLSAADAARVADALVLCTPWPQYKDVALAGQLPRQKVLFVVDATRFLGALHVEKHENLQCHAVGTPEQTGGVKGAIP